MPTQYDLIIRGGNIYDGSGKLPYVGDLAINSDRIAAIGDLGDAVGKTEIDAAGMAVAPGFINMLSWASTPLLIDGRSQSDLRQGVTLEVMGEGNSFGPLSPLMKENFAKALERDGVEVAWTTLGEYLEHLEVRGVSTNVASFVGATTLRRHEIADDDRPPTPEELARMCDLAREAMREGAVGLASALIYPPASFAGTDELIALAQAVGEYGGLYISHLRSEGLRLLDAFEEFVTIIKAAGIRGEIYHLKAMGETNWSKMGELIQRVEAYQAAGLEISADLYPYPAGATGLTASIPPWVQDGGREAAFKRLIDPETRAKILEEMRSPDAGWENLRLASGSDDGVLLTGFDTEKLRPLTGRSLGSVARERGTSPEETLLDLIVEDHSRVEDNIRKEIVLPWVSFCSDEGSFAPEGRFLEFNPHPRAYGAFSRVLARYVRDEGLVTVEEAVRRLSAFPASVLRIKERGSLTPGYYADVVVFDPATVQDHATFTAPHQYATGVRDVLVNGTPALRDGEHTGATPGRVVRGPGWTGWQ
jgi:N-acyl-D-amino-acid deacylase